MRTSTEINSAAKLIGEELAVEYIAKAGFDCWDFSMFYMRRYLNPQPGTPVNHPLVRDDYMTFVRRLKQIGLDNGITCNQSHAPFPTHLPQVTSYLKRAIECTAEAGGKICVIHPQSNETPEKNAEMFLELLPFAKEHDVKIATENMWNWDKEEDHSLFAACATSESFCAHLDAVNDPYLVACLDIGHAEMRGSGSGAANMIRALGSRLQAVHMHDNDLIHDSHQLPFYRQIDFSEVVGALRETGYQGEMTLEADCFLKTYYPDDVFAGIQKMAQTANKLVRMFEMKE